MQNLQKIILSASGPIPAELYRELENAKMTYCVTWLVLLRHIFKYGHFDFK